MLGGRKRIMGVHQVVTSGEKRGCAGAMAIKVEMLGAE